VTVRGPQCVCFDNHTVYPVGVDLMEMAFEHIVDGGAGFADLAASSNTKATFYNSPDSSVFGIVSTIQLANGSTVEVESGSSVRMPIADWVAGAATEAKSNIRNVTLNKFNSDLPADYRDSTRHPPFRSSGVAVLITVDYDNLNDLDSKPGYYNRQVHATITPKALTSQWAGNGPITHYNVYPTRPDASGAQVYDKIFRYRQGVVFTFQTTGTFYKMDWMYLLNAVIAGLVLLSVANSVAQTYAMYLAPNAVMIKNRTREFYNVEQRYAEIGLQALQRAIQFKAIDEDNDGQLEIDDVVQSLAKIKDITFDQAFAVAHLILERADNDKAPKSKDSITYDPDGAGKLDFSEYLVASAGGQMIPFEQYLKIAPTRAKIRTDIDRSESERKFAAARAKGFPELQPKRTISVEFTDDVPSEQVLGADLPTPAVVVDIVETKTDNGPKQRAAPEMRIAVQEAPRQDGRSCQVM